MNFDLDHSTNLLNRTPGTLNALLHNLPPVFLFSNEGPDTWNVHQVIAHLLYCDQHNWLIRTNHLLTHGMQQAFPPFDRFAHTAPSNNYTTQQLLQAFAKTRANALSLLQQLHLNDFRLQQKGMHAELGIVQLSQLLSAWVVHDLSHIAQINRIIAKQYKEAVGPWTKYLRILH